MFGKHFASMYTGSMVGAGFGPYAVMGYVISNQSPNWKEGYFSVDLNVKLLAATFGEPEEVVQKAIDYLCAPDQHSTTPDEEGKRLVKIGSFTYRVVNGAKYNKIRNEEERRSQNREAQERFRKKNKKPGKGWKKSTPPNTLPGELSYEKAVKNGDESTAQHLLDNPPS